MFLAVFKTCFRHLFHVFNQSFLRFSVWVTSGEYFSADERYRRKNNPWSLNQDFSSIHFLFWTFIDTSCFNPRKVTSGANWHSQWFIFCMLHYKNFAFSFETGIKLKLNFGPPFRHIFTISKIVDARCVQKNDCHEVEANSFLKLHHRASRRVSMNHRHVRWFCQVFQI